MTKPLLNTTSPLIALALATLAHQAHATDYWWDSNTTTAGFGNTTGIWGTSAFWSTSNAGTATPTAAVTSSTDIVNFGTATLNYANGTISIAAGGVTVNSIIYGAFQSTAINLGTVGNNLTLAGATPTITVNNPSASHTIISPVAGSAGLTKAGNGILLLTGTNAYTGGTSVNSGTLGFRNLTSKPASGTHAFGPGTTLGLGVGGSGFTTTDLDNAFAGTMTGNLSDVTVDATTNIGIDTTAGSLSYTVPGSPGRGLTKLGTNTLTLNGTNSYTGATTVAGGTLAVNTLANAGANSSIGNFATAGATGLTLSGGTFNYNGASATTDRGFTAIGASQKIISVGTGVNLTLGASVKNETAGGTSGLTFSASGVGSSITISSLTIQAGTGADFNLVGGVNPNVTIQNLNVTGSPVIHERTGTYILNIGNINGTGASGWLGGMNITGVISGYTGGIVLGYHTTFSGLSTFDTTVTAQQSGIYSFNTIKNVSGGASALGAPTTTANGTIHFGNGGNTPTLRYTGTGDSTDRVLNLKGSGTLNLEQAGSGLLHFTSSTTADAALVGPKTLNLTGSTSGTGEMSGAIVEYSATHKTSVSKSGTGKWTLSGANTYTGATTVNGGTLALGANNTLPNTTAVSIGAATLDAATFTDTAGTLAVTAAATINLGSSGAALVFADSSAVAWSGTTLNITGTLTPTSIRFGTTGGGLTVAQLDKITVNGTGLTEYSLNSSGYLIYDAGPPDTAAPTPNPMTFATVPAAASDSSITMTATTASDASGVDYYFDETSGNSGGTDSGWQSSPTYTDNGLLPSTNYTYTVTARDRSAALNTTAASAPASATTSAAPLYTVWNVQFASQSGNQIATTDNFIGAATENTANSTWNRVGSVPQSNMVLKRSTGTNTGVTLDYTGGNIGTQNLNNGPKIFNSRVGGNITLTLKGLSMTNSYDLVIYSDWWWKDGDALPITQTIGTGLTGTFHLNRVMTGNYGDVLALSRDTNPANDTGVTGNWMRVNGLTPTLAGELAFRITDGNNTPFNGFQLIATPVAPKADMLGLSLASNPPSIKDAVFSGTNVTLTVPYGTNVTNLAPTFTLWPGATCTTPSGTARNFTTQQTYTVISSDTLVTKNYIVSVVTAPPLPVFTLTAPANWDGRTTITAQPVISNLALLQANNGTNFTYNWSTSGVAVTQTTSPSIMTLTRSQGSGPLVVTLTMNNGTENVTASTTITVQEPSTDPWVERTPLANEKPVSNQFFARNPFTNLGTIFYRGTQSGTPDTVFLKVYKTPSGGSETLDATYTQSLVGGAYDFTAQIQAGLFTYRVVYGTTTGVTVTDVATVNNLLCGDAFIIEGQSNAQATDTGTTQEDISAPWVKTYDSSLGWGPAYARPTSPNWGSKVGFWGMKLAQDIVAQHSMPVCLINGAVGGTYIAQHQPNPANHTVGAGTYDIYANLLNRVIAARLTHGIRGVFWHQGESDAASFGPPLEPDYLSYEQNFLSMSSAWKQDYPNFQRYIVFQIAPNPCGIGPFASEIREIERQLPRLYSKMSLVNSIAVPGYQGCHYTPAGYESLASRVLPVVKRDFYGVTYSEAVTPPNLVRAYFTSGARTAIALEFDQAMSWSSFSLPNWHVNDVSNQVTSGSASGNIITLQLTSAAAANSTLDYVKDTWNYTESVSTLLYGANTVPALMPALTFADVSIGTLTPYESWTTSKNLSGPAADGDADPDFDSVRNALEFVLGGEPNPSAPGSNSSALLPTSTRNGAGDLVFTFKRKLASVGGVSLNFQWSNNLTFPALNTVPIGATNSTTDGITVAISVFDAATDNIIITVPVSKAVGGKLFGRLQAATQ